MGRAHPRDSSRAPAGKHIAWAYCHVPHGSTFDMSQRIESQIERFAPGVSIEAEYKGRGLGATWSTPDSRSAYMGEFVYE